MYTSSILMLLSWPAIILLSYYAVRFALYLYENRQGKQDV